MLYFIPAWYQNMQWCENEQSWQERRMHSEFDDTVKHVQLFNRNETRPYRILLLSYAPNFRHFLHRQSVYHAPYWSCFDAIQQIQRKQAVPLSFHQLAWPEGIEFVHTPFVIVAMLQGQKYARIEFGEDGNMIRIEMYQGEQIIRRNIYDDRGFVSSTILYREGKPFLQDYLMETGEWKIREFFTDGHVEVNPQYPEYLISFSGRNLTKVFSRRYYDSLEDVIEEVFSAYVGHTSQADIFCFAMHRLHYALLEKVLRKKKMILSFFQHRCDPGENPQTFDLIKKADYIITDSREKTEEILALDDRFLVKITDISPYDTRADFGISQQLHVQKILLPADGLEDVFFEELVEILGQYMHKNEVARVEIFTRNAAYNRPKQLMDQVYGLLDEEEEWITEHFSVEQCVDELEVSKCMREQRLVVEMRKPPELYLQVTAVSMGIPQIVSMETQFVVDKANGIVLSEVSQLPEALDYYLEGLANWNKAMVASYDLGKNYTTEVLLEKWREVLGFVE